MHSTMLRAYWKLEINGTVRPAQLECLILETRIEINSNRSFPLRIALKIPWTDSPYLSHSNVTNFILDHVHPWFWTGGESKHTPTLPQCLLEFEWLSGPLIHNSFITFLFYFLTKRSKWVKLKNWKINPNDKPLSLKRGYQPFNFPFDYRYLSTLKTVLKICAQANVLGLFIWSRMHGSISQLMTMKPKKRSFTRRRFRNCAPCSWRGKVQESAEIK